MFKTRKLVRGNIPALEIRRAYEKAFNVSTPGFWERLFMAITGQGWQSPFFFADNYYKETNEKLIRQILKEDETDLQEYVAEDFDCDVPVETAYSLGLFYADGSCNLRDGRYAGAQWRIVGWKEHCLKQAQVALEMQYPDMTFPLRQYSSYMKGSETNYGTRKKTLYCLEAAPREKHNDGSRGKFIEKFRATNYDQFGNKKVPAGILESMPISKRAFLQGVIDGDGSLIKNRPHIGLIYCHGIMQTTELIDLMHDCSWKFSFGRSNGNGNYWIYFNRKHEKLLTTPACDDFAFRLMGVFHQNRKVAAMGIFITWAMTPRGGHALLSYYVDGEVKLIEPQNDKIFPVPGGWRLILLCG